MWDTLLPCPACKSEKVYTNTAFLKDTRYVACSDCGLSGPKFKTRDLAILAWNALPRSPKFSSTTPSSEGFYWLRDGGRKPEVIWVRKELASHPKKLVAFYTGNEVEEDIDNIEGAEWAGPLEAPK